MNPIPLDGAGHAGHDAPSVRVREPKEPSSMSTFSYPAR